MIALRDADGAADVSSVSLTPSTQAILGDDDESSGRLAELREKTCDILSKSALSKPKDAMLFFTHIQYKTVGGQQLTCNF